MPSFVAASITVAPLSTVTGLPSIWRLIGISVCGHLVRDGIRIGVLLRGAVAARLHVAALVADVVLELAPEHLHERPRWHRRRVAERADRAALDVVQEVEQEIQVFHAALAVLDAVQDPVEPAGAFAAWRALPARLLEVEV